METMEMYFLVLVCGAFGLFAVSLIMLTIREKAHARAAGRKSLK